MLSTLALPPDAPRLQQPLCPAIDTASELDMLHQQIRKIQELQHRILVVQGNIKIFFFQKRVYPLSEGEA
jgi:hypothetical protein